MNDLLESYAIEANLIEPEPHVDIGLIEGGQLCFDTQPLEEHDSVAEQLTEVGAVFESLESYTSKFLDLVSAESWNGLTTQQFQLGVKAIFGAVGFNLADSMIELSTESSEDAKTQTEGKVKGLLARMWEAFKAAIGSFIEMILRLADNYGKSVGAVGKMITTLKDRLASNKGAPTKSKFTGSPKWTAYMRMDGETLMPERSLAITARLITELGGDWVKNYARLREVIGKTIEAGKPVTVESFKGNNAIYTQGIGPWPGGAFVTIRDDKNQSELGMLTQTVHVERKIELVTNPAVLTGSEINQLIDRMVSIHNAMRAVHSELGFEARSLKRFADSLKTTNAKVGPQVLSKIISRIAVGPRTLLPLAGGIVQDAFLHANASLRSYQN